MTETISDKINIGKKYPGYFNQWLFKTLVVAMVLLFIVALWSNDWTWSGEYNECASDTPCMNAEYSPNCPVGSGCSIQVMQPGTYYGTKPSFLAANAGLLEFFIVAVAFLLNHVIYMWKRTRSAQ